MESNIAKAICFIRKRKSYLSNICLRSLPLMLSVTASFFIFACAVTERDSSPVSRMTSLAKQLEEGTAFYEKGDYVNAITVWENVAAIYNSNDETGKYRDILIKLSQAYQATGHYNKALELLENALSLARDASYNEKIAVILSNIGNVYIAMGPNETAAQYANDAVDMARGTGNPRILSYTLNNYGNVLAAQGKSEEAIRAYEESAALSTPPDQSLIVAALTNAAASAREAKKYEKAKSLIDQAFQAIDHLADSHEKAYGLIKIGSGYLDLVSHVEANKDPLYQSAFDSFNLAAITAEAINDQNALCYAWGYMGKLYEEKKAFQKALNATRNARFLAQQLNSPEALYQWEWQSGRIFNSLGELDTAIAAYRRAFDSLQSIRHETSVIYGSKPSLFRDAIGPLYYELVDLLLKRAALFEKPMQYEPYLIEAREKIEQLKLAELQDYFKDECMAALQSKTTSLDKVSLTAIVVYPILLPDRIELLVNFPDGMKRYVSNISLDTLTKEVRAFRKSLVKRISREYLLYARNLYDWLIRPMESDLMSSAVDTLVFIPDGPLRTIPMAALNDGQTFLINKFALAITPGLNLTDPQPIEKQKINILTVGLTESSQGFPPLPFVEGELDTIADLYGGQRLLNKNFSLSAFEEALLDEPYNIIHIASHGEFDSDSNKTFLLAFDDKLTIDRLDHCVGFFRFREEPLELLTLSACKTAAGDDRAALGLAGVAVKASARSALATLWYVNDQASSELVSEFYRQLKAPSVSRAVALQRAQLKIQKHPLYDHPCYWAPFLLINNWL